MPNDAKEDLPGTIQRSPKKAQRTYAKTLEAAHEQYDDEARAHQTAFASLKHSFEKVGDHWEPKPEKGPSDPQAKGGAGTNRPTAGGVDVIGHTRDELMEGPEAGCQGPFPDDEAGVGPGDSPQAGLTLTGRP